ncbi:MAG: hypothetical protein B5M56_00815 [Desulfococcus sp. 4484_241]|nr:MAG: hypothetical protein B5M56_00815 [Desulfococcus sp. 4484_241]
MAHFHIKKKKERPYLYVREIARVDGKPKVVPQVYIGAPEKVAAMASGQKQAPSKLKVEEFGTLMTVWLVLFQSDTGQTAKSDAIFLHVLPLWLIFVG